MKNNSEYMVTKTEFKCAIAQMVTKTEFEVAMKKMVTKTEFEIAMTKMVTKTEFQEAIRRLEETMYTKADHAKFMEWMDEAMAELRDAREERKLSERQVLRIDDIVFDHEKRIRVLEKR